MPTENLEDELYRIYDVAVGKDISELMNRSPYHDSIRLRGFNRKDKEHLFVLRIALMVRDLYNIPVEVGTNWWDGFVINWKIRKSFDKIKIVKSDATNSIWVPCLVGKIKAEIKTEKGICLHLDNVYDTYYEGSCG